MESDLIEEELFSFPGGGFGQNILMFGVDILLFILIIRKKHIGSWNITNTKARTYTNCRKNVFN